MRRGIVLICLLLWANVQAAELYRSIDKDGKVHYSDTPLEGSEDFEKLKAPRDPSLDENLPYESKIARQNFPVTLYTSPECGTACKQGRELLSKRGIPFSEKNVQSQAEIDAFRKESGYNQLPVLSIGKTWLKGFLATEWHKELDFAGYPKSVYTYRPPAPPTASPAQPAQ